MLSFSPNLLAQINNNCAFAGRRLGWQHVLIFFYFLPDNLAKADFRSHGRGYTYEWFDCVRMGKLRKPGTFSTCCFVSSDPDAGPGTAISDRPFV